MFIWLYIKASVQKDLSSKCKGPDPLPDLREHRLWERALLPYSMLGTTAVFVDTVFCKSSWARAHDWLFGRDSWSIPQEHLSDLAAEDKHAVRKEKGRQELKALALTQICWFGSVIFERHKLCIY